MSFGSRLWWRSGVAALSLLLLSGCDGPRYVEISEPGGGAYEASLARPGDGGARWMRALSDPARRGRNVIARVENGRLFCAWIEKGADHRDAAIWAQWLDLDLGGRPLSPPQRLADAGPTTWNLNAAIDGDGRAWVVCDATAGTRTDEIFLVGADDAWSSPVPLTDDDGVASKYPDLAFGANTAAVTWFDERDGNQEVYLAVAAFPQLRDRFEAHARRVTATAGASIGGYVAWNDGRVGLAWSDDTEGEAEVYFQAFDVTGAALHAAKRLTNNPTASLIPAIQPWGDGFALAWNEDVVEQRRDHQSGGRSDIVFATVR